MVESYERVGGRQGRHQAPGSRRALWLGLAALLPVAIIVAVVIVPRLRAPATATVPDLTQEDITTAVDTLEARDLRPRLVELPDAEVPRDRVIRTDPVAGQDVEEEGEVTVFFSIGPPPIAIPALNGLPMEEAEQALREAGLQPGVEVQQSSDRPAGTVLETDPPAGIELPPGTSVALVLSSGPVLLPLPEVVGLDQPVAVSELEQAGFEVTLIGRDTGGVSRVGEVLEQEPAAGTTLPPGGRVTLVVASE